MSILCRCPFIGSACFELADHDDQEEEEEEGNDDDDDDVDGRSPHQEHKKGRYNGLLRGSMYLCANDCSRWVFIGPRTHTHTREYQ